MATIKPTGGFSPQADATALRKAMRGIGCNDKEVIQILARRTNKERQQIKQTYKTMHGKDLEKELEGELRGKLEDIILVLMTPSYDYDCEQLKRAMDGIGTNEEVLVEILSTRTNDEIRAIRLAYKKLYDKDLEKEIKKETSFNFERLLVSLTCGGRDESTFTDKARAQEDAEALHKAGVKKIGTDEGAFNAILISQNHHQLRLVMEAYQALAGHPLEHAIKQEFSGDLQMALLALVQQAKSIGAYFAERLHKSMAGAGTRDTDLMRLVISRAEKDMILIKQEFQTLYGRSLESVISGDCSGKYKDVLLTLIAE